MLKKNLFCTDGFDFCDQAPKVTRAEILSSLSVRFDDLDDFVEFYEKNNGGYFNGGAYIYRDVFCEIKYPEINSMEIESFYFIENLSVDKRKVDLRSAADVLELRRGYSAAARVFCEAHYPFAGDAGDNDFWIDVETGKIKYILWESSKNVSDVVDVAPNFSEFVNNIVPRRRNI
ncbi:SMI1/KNR4 family protein [Burkholderia stagnalis]